jgi:hypothetical protein
VLALKLEFGPVTASLWLETLVGLDTAPGAAKIAARAIETFALTEATMKRPQATALILLVCLFSAPRNTMSGFSILLSI